MESNVDKDNLTAAAGVLDTLHEHAAKQDHTDRELAEVFEKARNEVATQRKLGDHSKP